MQELLHHPLVELDWSDSSILFSYDFQLNIIPRLAPENGW